VETLRPGATFSPIHIGDAVLMRGSDPEYKFRADGEALFVLGLTPKATYDIEVDNEEMSERETDTGGTLVISLAPGVDGSAPNLGGRLKKRIK
jgi:hypothetical protein